MSETDQYRLLLPVLEDADEQSTDVMLDAATAIAADRGGEVLIAYIVQVPQQTPYEVIRADDDLMRDTREHTERLVEQAPSRCSVQGIVCITHRDDRAIMDMIGRHDCSGTVLEVGGESSQRRRILRGDTVEKIAARAPTDVFVFKLPEANESVEHVLLAVSDGPHTRLAAETARLLARTAGASVDILHLLPEDANGSQRVFGQGVLDETSRLMEDVEHTKMSVTSSNVSEEIIGRSESYDVTVLGSPTRGLLKQFVFGTVPDKVVQSVDEQVVMVKRAGDREPSAVERWLKDGIPESRSEGG